MLFDDMTPTDQRRYRSGSADGMYVHTYFRTPEITEVLPGQIQPIDLLVVPGQTPPFHATHSYREKEVAKGKHLVVNQKFIEVQVTDFALEHGHSLYLLAFNDIRSQGLRSAYNVEPGKLVDLKIWSTRPGGFILSKRGPRADQIDVLFAVTDIDYNSSVIRIPEDADYITKNPRSFTLDVANLSAGIRVDEVDLGDGDKKLIPVAPEDPLNAPSEVRLTSKVSGTTPIAIGKVKNGRTALSCNPGTYYVKILTRMFYMYPKKGQSFDLLGKVVISEDTSGDVSIVPLSDEEKEEWDSFEAVLK
ncbi:hypothetical protein BVX99_00335 [bacterium F16]|nr:hypothetical protein BVX99_00335 [bacterium F16]